MTIPADILRAARIARGFTTAAECARHFGWHVVTYTSHENGTRQIRAEVAERYANALGIDAAALLGFEGRSTHIAADDGVEVAGVAAWGVWRDMALVVPVQPFDRIDVPSHHAGKIRRALMVGDDSVNRVAKQGDFLIYEPLTLDELGSIALGKLIVIGRRNGSLQEISVRRVLSSVDREVRLAAHSTSPSYSEILRLPLDQRPAGLDVIGLVVAKYEPL